MRKTPTLSLVLIASVTLTACSSDQKGTQQVYKSRADCVQAWGDARECDPVESGSSYPLGHYYGPSFVYLNNRPVYYPRSGRGPLLVPNTALDGGFAVGTARSTTANRAVKSVGTVKRGGFGASSRLAVGS